MRIFLIYTSLIGAFFLEQVLNFPGSDISLNLLTVLAVFYFTRKNFQENLVIACFVGILYDLTSTNFFGVYFLIFVLTCLFIRIIVDKFFPVNMSFLNTQLTVTLGLTMIVILKIILFSLSWFGDTNLKIIINSFYWSDVLIQTIVSLILIIIVYPFWRFVTSIKNKDILHNNDNV